MRIGPILLAATIGAGVTCVAASPKPSILPTTAPSGTTAVPPAFTGAVDGLIGGLGGDAAVWISDPSRALPLYQHNADTQVVAASLYKLGILLHVESLVDAGTMSYSDTITIEDADVTVDGSDEPPDTTMTVDAALESMITYSDNGSAMAFVRLLGADKVNATLMARGIRDFHLAEDPNEDNLVTARALGTFFTSLAKGKLLSADASRRMLARLERQHINDRLPRDLPAGAVVAHKTGDLVDAMHDAGIIQTPAGPRVAVVLTTGAGPTDAQEFIAAVGSLVYSVRLASPGAPGTTGATAP